MNNSAINTRIREKPTAAHTSMSIVSPIQFEWEIRLIISLVPLNHVL